MEATIGLGRWFGFAQPFDEDAVRHILLAGFLSSLLFGMAPRMIPGFLGKRSVAFPSLVGVTFVLWQSAVLFRVSPLLIGDLLGSEPWALAFVYGVFGLSGPLGWVSVALLGWNLLATRRLQ